MTILSIVDYFKELSFYNVSIDKPKIKRLKNIDLLTELPFYDQLNIIKTDHAFSGFGMFIDIYLSFAHATIRQKYMTFFLSFILSLCTIIRSKISVLIN